MWSKYLDLLTGLICLRWSDQIKLNLLNPSQKYFNHIKHFMINSIIKTTFGIKISTCILSKAMPTSEVKLSLNIGTCAYRWLKWVNNVKWASIWRPTCMAWLVVECIFNFASSSRSSSIVASWIRRSDPLPAINYLFSWILVFKFILEEDELYSHFRLQN